MRKTSPKTQMSLWKAFEADRVASGEQEQYVKAAAGPGNQKRKRKMLGGWILDGGPEELKARVNRGTIKYRRNPEDGKYWQFRFAQEKEEIWQEKSQTRRGLTEGTSSKDEMIQWKKAMKDPLN
ncbi:unnamed protein product, partial [Symbiodinium microadriaticum]